MGILGLSLRKQLKRLRGECALSTSGLPVVSRVSFFLSLFLSSFLSHFFLSSFIFVFVCFICVLFLCLHICLCLIPSFLYVSLFGAATWGSILHIINRLTRMVSCREAVSSFVSRSRHLAFDVSPAIASLSLRGALSLMATLISLLAGACGS
jgi:hypothetical protein